mgnify:CR=1 FL=1
MARKSDHTIRKLAIGSAIAGAGLIHKLAGWAFKDTDGDGVPDAPRFDLKQGRKP